MAKDVPIWERYNLTEELWGEIIARRTLRVLSYGNFVGFENTKATETFTGEQVRQVRGVGVIVQTSLKTRMVFPWSRVIDFEYHNRDPLMWMHGAIS